MGLKIVNMQNIDIKKMIRSLCEQVRFFFFAILIALVVRSCLYEPFRIPSGSMLPTLLIGDYIFVSKFSYGYSRYSFPFNVLSFSGRFFNNMPQRGDVTVFRNPVTPKIIYIKRIIGLPGDEIQMRLGKLYINDLLVPRVQIEDFHGITRYNQTVSSEKTYQILEQYGDDSLADNTRIYHVPDGHYFAMGDNRDNSQDSRFLSMVGYIPEENLVGRATMVWLSLDLEEWSPRIGRFFTLIK